MTESAKPELGSTTTDLIASFAKVGAGQLPIVGSLVSEVVGNIIPNQRVDRIAEFVRLLDERVSDVEQSLLTERFKQPEVVDVLEDAFIQAARATSQERLEHIANIVANGISPDELNTAETKRMLWLLGQLNDSEVILLRSKLGKTREDAQADAAFREKHEELLVPDTTVTGSAEEEFDKAALTGSYKQHLHELGLLKKRFKRPKRSELPEFDHKTGMMNSSGSELTRLGKMLLRYLDIIPDWYSERFERSP